MPAKTKVPVTRRSYKYDNVDDGYVYDIESFDAVDHHDHDDDHHHVIRDEVDGLELDFVDMGFHREGVAPAPRKAKRKGERTTPEFAYDFGWFEMLVGMVSIFMFYLDVGTDVYLVIQYFWADNIIYATVTLILTAGPSLITCFLGLHWYIIDYMKDKQNQNIKTASVRSIYIISTGRWIIRFVFTILQMGPVIRISEYLYYGKKSQTKSPEEKKHFYWQMLFEDVDACLLRLFESFLESAPQLMWQLYIWITLKPNEDVVTASIRAIGLLSSWGSLSISLLSYHKSLRFSKKEKRNMRKIQMPAYFLWRACEVGSRILCLSLFASAFQLFVFVPCTLHWILSSIWLMCQRTSFYENVCLEKAFNVICAYVMIFCYLNLREGHTRYRYVAFYLVFYLENGVMLAMWYLFTPDIGSWFHVYGFIIILVMFVLHIIFQLLYYYCFHPSGHIKLCLPLDNEGKTCWESLCYDLDESTSDQRPPMVEDVEIVISEPNNKMKNNSVQTTHRNSSAHTFV